MKKIRQFSHSQKGAVSVLVALTLPVLVGAGALAVDLAYLHVVRNQLQNDADAAALAGARKLYTIGASALDADGDLLDFDLQEVRVSQALIRRARQTISPGRPLTLPAVSTTASAARAKRWTSTPRSKLMLVASPEVQDRSQSMFLMKPT